TAAERRAGSAESHPPEAVTSAARRTTSQSDTGTDRAVPAGRHGADVAGDVVARVLARAASAVHTVRVDQHAASADRSDGHAARRGGSAGDDAEYGGDELDLAERVALRRVGGLSTEVEDVTEVEYRQLRLEKVVLVGVWTSGSSTDAENSLR